MHWPKKKLKHNKFDFNAIFLFSTTVHSPNRKILQLSSMKYIHCMQIYLTIFGSGVDTRFFMSLCKIKTPLSYSTESNVMAMSKSHSFASTFLGQTFSRSVNSICSKLKLFINSCYQLFNLFNIFSFPFSACNSARFDTSCNLDKWFCTIALGSTT